MKSFRVCEEMLDMLINIQWDIENLAWPGDFIPDAEFYEKDEFINFGKFMITNCWYPECIDIHEFKEEFLLHGHFYKLYRRHKMLEVDMRIADSIMNAYKASK